MASTLTRVPKIPKYQKLTQQLRLQVESGELRPGDRLPSFVEMKEQYGISQATIERIYVTLEQEGLAVREQGRGTFVARAVPRNATGILGVLGARGNEFQNSLYWAHLLDGVREVAAGHNMQVLLIEVDTAFDPWEKVDGLLFAGLKKEPAREFLGTPAPKVSLLVSLPGVPSVGADDYGGTYAATEHLLSLGHRRIGMVGIGGDILSNTRFVAYKTALDEAGIEPDPRWVRRMCEPFDDKEPFVAQGRDRMREWLDNDWEELGCTALIAQNDQVAVGAIQSLSVAGIRVPDDVSIVGFDGTELYDHFSPRLTTVEVPLKKIGAEGARMLLRHIRGETAEANSISLATPLRVHDSTGPAPIGT